MSLIYKYKLSGYTFETNVHLPELMVSEENSQGNIIVRKDVSDRIPVEALNRKSISYPELNLICINSDSIGFLAIWDKHHIEFTPNFQVNDAFLRMVLLGSVSMLLANSFQLLSLHAACVVVKDKAVLFCAKSGRGKSSLAAYFYSKGYVVLADDVINVQLMDSGKLYAFPSVPRIKLSEEALIKIGKTKEGLLAIPAAATKYSLPMDFSLLKEKYEISEVIFPEFEGEENSFEVLKGMEKLRELTKHIYRYRLGIRSGIFDHRRSILFAMASQLEMKFFFRSSENTKMNESLKFIESMLRSKK